MMAETLNVGVIAKNNRNVKNKFNKVVAMAESDCKRKNITNSNETITIAIKVALSVAEKASLALLPSNETKAS